MIQVDSIIKIIPQKRMRIPNPFLISYKNPLDVYMFLMLRNKRGDSVSTLFLELLSYLKAS